jgi:Ca2+-binding RTX toxin-like protein
LADYIDGGSGADTINGAGGADSIVGGLGDDSIIGGAGADTIVGGSGSDVIALGDADAAADLVFLNAITDAGDTISQFEGGTGGDVILIGGTLKTALDGDTVIVDGDLSDNANAGADYAIETDAIGVVAAAENGTLTLAHLTTAGYSAVATAIAVAFEFTDAGSDSTLNVEIFVVESDTVGTFGIYAWTQAAADDVTVGGSELVLLGIVTGSLGEASAGDIAIA